MIIREAVQSELPDLSDLCLRSKAHWGYDTAFLEACREELTVKPDELVTTSIVVAEHGSRLAGIAQVSIENADADLLKLFVDPEHIGQGIGKALFQWAVREARRLGARRMTIEADPDAEGFYRRLGARVIGQAPSGSISGRFLPRLELPLDDQVSPRTI